MPHRGICMSGPVKMKRIRKIGNRRLGVKAQLPDAFECKVFSHEEKAFHKI